MALPCLHCARSLSVRCSSKKGRGKRVGDIPRVPDPIQKQNWIQTVAAGEGRGAIRWTKLRCEVVWHGCYRNFAAAAYGSERRFCNNSCCCGSERRSCSHSCCCLVKQIPRVWWCWTQHRPMVTIKVYTFVYLNVDPWRTLFWKRTKWLPISKYRGRGQGHKMIKF